MKKKHQQLLLAAGAIGVIYLVIKSKKTQPSITLPLPTPASNYIAA